jgi:hypothetical protein
MSTAKPRLLIWPRWQATLPIFISPPNELHFIANTLAARIASLAALSRSFASCSHAPPHHLPLTQSLVMQNRACPARCRLSNLNQPKRIGMRAYIIAASLTLSLVGKASGTVVDTGKDVQKYCAPLTKGSFQDNDEARLAGTCEGMVETAVLFAPNLPADVRGCPPAMGSTVATVKVLLRYLDRNPDRLEEAGITLALEAFRDAWPCPGDDADAPGGGPKTKKPASKKRKQ